MEVKSANAQINQREVTWEEFEDLCDKFQTKVRKVIFRRKSVSVYGIPVGGWFVARETVKNLSFLERNPMISQTLIMDDIVDSGKTIKPYVKQGFATASLFLKDGASVKPDVWLEEVPRDCWVLFPWEAEREIEDSVQRIIEFIGENPSREGLVDTPKRVIKAWEEFCIGYSQDPKEVLHENALFTEHNEYDQIIVLKDIEFFSNCEHHMLPFYGKVDIGYLPSKKVAGVSKLIRMVNVFSRRLQIQERLTQEIADAIQDVLKPRGVGVVIEAVHLCMMGRGVKQGNAKMLTSAMRGSFLEEHNKDEFMRLTGR